MLGAGDGAAGTVAGSGDDPGSVREVRRVGDVGVLVACDGPEDALGVADGLRALGRPGGPLAAAGLVDVMPAARTVLVTGRAGELSPSLVAEALDRFADEASGAGRGSRPPGPGVDQRATGDASLACGVRFDGPDLEGTASLLGLSSAQLVEHVASVEWTVAFCGFAPGFGYCVGGGLDVPRLDRPRTRVPARSVGLAGPYAGVYPRESPGGWRLVGRLADDVPALFDPDRDPPALLAPGRRLRLEPR